LVEVKKLFAWVVDHPLWTIGLVLLVTIGLMTAIPSLETETDFSKFMSKDDPIIQLMDQAEERYGRTFGIFVMVLTDEGIFNEETLAKIKTMEEGFEAIPGVKSVSSPLSAQIITGTETALNVRSAAPSGEVPTTDQAMAAFREDLIASRMLRDSIISSDGRAGAISIELKVGADEATITKEVIKIIEPFTDSADQIYIYGDAYIDALMNEEMGRDMLILFPLTVLMIVTVLFFSFMNLRGVLLPLTIVVLSVLMALGAMSLVGFPVTIVSFIAPVMLLAIGIADGIHVLNRYREEAEKGLPKRETILNTMNEMKGPVIMTSLTTAAGFLSLLSSFFIPQKHLGVIAAVGVIAAMVLSLVMIPAVLALLKLPRARRKERGLRPLTRVLLVFERLVIRYRRVVLLGAVIVFAAMLAGFPFLQIETSNKEMLGEDHPAIRIMNLSDQHFAGSMQVTIEIETELRDGLKDPQVLKKMVELEEHLSTEGVSKTISLTSLVREMNQKFHSDDPAYYVIPEERSLVSQLLLLFTFQGGKLGDMALGDFSAGTITGMYKMTSTKDISEISRRIQTYLDENFTGQVKARMVGMTILMDRMMTRMMTSQFVGLATTMSAVGFIVMLLMGSIIAALIALIPLILTVAINFGLMAYTGISLNIMTLMVSTIAIGIGVDYSIHFISRFRHEYRIDNDANRAMQATVRTTGRGITYNALTVALGFGILVFASFKGIRFFGLQIALTMVVSSVSAISIIPAILIHWQPKFLSRPTWGKDETLQSSDE
jgi:predicted RND superfamily exporter protein